MSVHTGVSLRGEQLRQGYVLNQDLVELGLFQGRVLTADDIVRINALSSKIEVNVLIIRKTKDTVSERIQKTSAESKEQPKTSKPVRQDLKPKTLSEKKRAASLFDSNANHQIKQNLEKKKQIFRGVNYDEEVEHYRREHIEKFGEELKYVQGLTKQASIEAIDHYAKTRVDFDKISQAGGGKVRELMELLDRYEMNVTLFLKAVLTEKKVYTGYVEDIVFDIIKDMGYKLSRELFSLSVRESHNANFLVSHTVLVLMTALITAIELTKMINDKMATLQEDNINVFLSISKKSFSIEELINLGIAAIMHDIGFLKQFPGLKADHHFSLQEESKIDLHPSEGFHIAKMTNLDFDVQRAIFQHHERFDGSGYPNGTQPRLFSKYTPILMFAEYYVENTTQNPFVEEAYLPRQVVVDILAHRRNQFDGDVIYAFLRAASLFPVGSWVRLNNGQIGIVAGVNPKKLDSPVVKAVFDKNFKKIDCEDINLLESQLTIVRPVSLETIRRFAPDPVSCVVE